MTDSDLNIIGMTLAEVASVLDEQEYSYRIVCRDGVARVGIRNFDLRRVNLTIVDGKITGFDFG